MLRNWKKLDSKLVYSNPWIKLRQDRVVRPDGNQGIYAFIEKYPGNFIIALDKEDNIYLIEEYRYPIKKSVLQLPAGVIDSDDVLKQAQKELYEETGLKAGHWEKLGDFFVAPGHETTQINVFLATDLDISGLKTDNQENDELILRIVKMSIPEVKNAILGGQIECGITLAALNLFFLKHKN